MAQYSKSIETKNSIIKTARTLFYDRGFTATTTRQIAESSGTSLGLIKYHFGSKNNIAIEIYRDIRDTFDQKLETYGYGETPLKYFLFSCSLELYLCLENKPFGRFYREITSEPEILSYIREMIIDGLKHIITTDFDKSDFTFTCISMSSIKPSLTEYALSNIESFDTEKYLHFYLKTILIFFHEDVSIGDETLYEMKNYYINIVENFTPILEKIIGN